jgi:hypothetical protein
VLHPACPCAVDDTEEYLDTGTQMILEATVETLQKELVDVRKKLERLEERNQELAHSAMDYRMNWLNEYRHAQVNAMSDEFVCFSQAPWDAPSPPRRGD